MNQWCEDNGLVLNKTTALNIFTTGRYLIHSRCFG